MKWEFEPPRYAMDETACSASINLYDNKGFLKAFITLEAYPSDDDIKAAKLLVKMANKGKMRKKSNRKR